MKYGKSKLLEILQNTPRQGWTWQKIKDLIDSLWRDWHPPVTIAPASDDYLSIGNNQVLSFDPSALPGGRNDITETPAGAVNGVNTIFTLSQSPVVSTIRVYLNGVRQIPGVSYTVSSGTITFTIAPFTADVIIADYKPSAPALPRVIGETPTGAVNGANTGFDLAETPVASSEQVYLNGVRQQPTANYSVSGNTITFITAPFTGDVIIVDYMPSPTVSDHMYNEIPTGAINGINTDFVLSNTPISVYVWLNGVRQTDFTLTGNTISFTTAPYSGDIILVDYEY